MKKQVFAVISVLAVSASIIFSGCGNQGNETAAEASSGAEVTKAAEESTPEPTKEVTKEPAKEVAKEPAKEVTKAPEKKETAVVIEEGVITDENGVSVTEMEISINTPETGSFDFTTNNPEGTDVTFDQTRIELVTADGTKLDPFADNSEPIDASAQIERHFFDMDTGNIKNGDEIKVYFDGEYVTSITVTGGPMTSGSSGAESSEQSSEAPAAAENASGSAAEGSFFVGDWKLYAMEHDNPEQSITHEEIEEAKEQGMDYSLLQLMTLRDNGTYAINMMGDISEGAWTDNGDGTGTLNTEGIDFRIEMDGELLKAYADDNITWFERSEYSAV